MVTTTSSTTTTASPPECDTWMAWDQMSDHDGNGETTRVPGGVGDAVVSCVTPAQYPSYLYYVQVRFNGWVGSGDPDTFAIVVYHDPDGSGPPEGAALDV
ncbi:MAG: hypothetical protein M5R36_18935 [Deltaproteobacteria bacterium]|nr:hypothetical protein [Deltaproteobacteria bacterium]